MLKVADAVGSAPADPILHKAKTNPSATTNASAVALERRQYQCEANTGGSESVTYSELSAATVSPEMRPALPVARPAPSPVAIPRVRVTQGWYAAPLWLPAVAGISFERDSRRASGRLLRQSGMDASYVDLADPTHLEFAYLRWMRIVLRVAGARRVLHVGGGACALARALAAEDPGGRQLVFEVDAGVLALAREHLGLRSQPGLQVRHAEGRSSIASEADSSWDAVVIDAFIDATLPRRLITVEALADAARVAPLTLINVAGDSTGNELCAVAAGLAEAYPQVWSIGAPSGNMVLAGDGANVDANRVATQAAADPAPAWLTPPGAMARLIAGTPALRDPD